MEKKTPVLNQFVNHPFSSFVILSPQTKNILYFSQAFTLISGFHPSTILVPETFLEELNLELKVYRIDENFEIVEYSGIEFDYKSFWIETLIHELRTASLTIGLGAYTFAENQEIAPLLLRKLLRASHRQKIATLIASDFIQLVSVPPNTYPLSLVRVLNNSLSNTPAPFHMKLKIGLIVKTSLPIHFNPIIWGDFHFLANFFITILSWLEAEPVMIELEIINPIAVKVSLTIPPDRFLSQIQGFSLIPHYIQYISGYFNGCSWLTQSSINFLFPLILEFSS